MADIGKRIREIEIPEQDPAWTMPAPAQPSRPAPEREPVPA